MEKETLDKLCKSRQILLGLDSDRIKEDLGLKMILLGLDGLIKVQEPLAILENLKAQQVKQYNSKDLVELLPRNQGYK